MKLVLLGLTVLTVLASGLVVFLLNFTAPQNPEGELVVVNLVYFFTSAFLSLAGSVTLVLYWVGNLRSGGGRASVVEVVHKPRLILLTSLRHGVLVATTLVGIGVLNATNLSNPLNIVLIISAAILTEVYLFGH